MRKLVLFLIIFLSLVNIQASPKQVTEYKVYIPLLFKSDLSYGVQDQCGGCYFPYYSPSTLVFIPFRLDEYEAGMIDIDRIKTIATSYSVILGIRTFPEWSRLYPEIKCSPPNPTSLESLSQEILYLLNYINPRGISISNEPNVSSSSYPFIGCYENAYQYAQVANYFYVRIKQERPDIEIIIGELAGCPTEFVDELLYHIHGNYDSFSYHKYAFFGGSTDQIGNCAMLLRSKLLPNKNLYLTETALLYDGDCSDPEFQQSQINHFVYMQNLIYFGLVDKAYWYTIDRNGPWRCSALTSAEMATPVYEYYRVILNVP